LVADFFHLCRQRPHPGEARERVEMRNTGQAIGVGLFPPMGQTKTVQTQVGGQMYTYFYVSVTRGDSDPVAFLDGYPVGRIGWISSIGSGKDALQEGLCLNWLC
jgi:hypothetical protein